MNASEDRRHIDLHKTHGEKNKPLFVTNRIRTTKYNIITFLPKNLFEQFSRIANFYFLIIICLLQFPWAPISAAAAVVPLVIVILISMIREGVEDFLRYLSDQRINGTTGHVLMDGEFQDVRWDSMLVGQIAKVYRDEQIPVDMILISTNDSEALSYVDTCNLDGETNLKVRQGLQITKGVTTPEHLSQFNSHIECDLPNNKLYTFNGNIDINGQQYSLDNKQLLLRGCILRNTEWAIGAVVYTGHDSKLMMNSRAARSKRSLLERGLNLKLVSIFIFIVVAGFMNCTIGFLFEKNQINTGKHWYFYRNESNRRDPASTFFILLVSCVVIINATIPISLYVTLEVVRVFQALFVAWDAEMYDIETETFAKSRTSNISDDLGQIEYVFSDKTGTLTRNVMEFMKCSIAGKSYGSGTTEVAFAAAKRRGLSITPPDTKGKAFKDADFMEVIASNPPEEIKQFLHLLSLNHAVIPEADETKEHGYRFEAPSPDEAALVSAAADFGYVFVGRNPEYLTLKLNGQEKVFDLLANLEFTSERKRSSVIIRDPDTKHIILYCKGADDTILSRLDQKSLYVEETKLHLKEYAANGLRTLCCGYKYIDEGFFRDWKDRYDDANCSIIGREAAVEAIAEEIEKDLLLLGATAIEDKLQEGVPDTIEALLRAGIRVWVITGDKRETAINIGFACSLLSSEMQLVILDSDDTEKLTQEVDQALNSNSQNLALVASGTALHILLDKEHEDTFFKISQKCQSVICCRVSPLQKSDIVRIVREKTHALTLAIGDGANDVGMILTADVGCGISGKEGRQAVLASDYSFSQFKFLKRLLLFHGRLNFIRNVELINYSFYKNMAFSLNNIIFQFFSSWSGNTMYDSMLYTVFNVIFTSVPPVIYAGLEREVSIESMMNVPELYYFDGKRKWLQSYPRFWLNLFLGMFHGVCAFLIPYFAMRPYTYNNGQIVGFKEFGITVYGAVVFIVNFRIAFLCQYWTWLHHFFIWCSALIYPLIAIVIDLMGISSDMRGVTIPLLGSSQFWFPIFAASILSVIPLIAEKIIHNALNLLVNRVAYAEMRKGGQRIHDVQSLKLSDLDKSDSAYGDAINQIRMSREYIV